MEEKYVIIPNCRAYRQTKFFRQKSLPHQEHVMHQPSRQSSESGPSGSGDKDSAVVFMLITAKGMQEKETKVLP